MREWRIELDEEEGELSAWLVFCDEKTIAAQLAFDNEPGENDWGFSKEDARQLVQFIVDACNEKEQREADEADVRGTPVYCAEDGYVPQAEQRLRDLAEPECDWPHATVVANGVLVPKEDKILFWDGSSLKEISNADVKLPAGGLTATDSCD